MRHKVRIHYDNKNGFLEPVMWIWVSDGATLEREVEPSGQDGFGVYYDLSYNRSSFNFLFKDGKGEDVPWEDQKFNRSFHLHMGNEIWSMAYRHNIYNVLPEQPKGSVKDYYQQIRHLIPEDNFYFPMTDVSGLNIPSMLGATLLKDGTVLFGFFHPYAARVYLVGNFNDWQSPGHPAPREEQFIPMELHLGYYYQPNIWLARITPETGKPIEYKFYLQGGAVENERYVVDPYTRLYSDDYKNRNAVVVDPTKFKWSDRDWKTPDVKDLILVEKTNDFYNWTKGLINLRKRYEALRLSGYNPIDEGKFNWLLGP